MANAERRFTHGPEEPLSPRGRDEALAAGRAILARFDPVALFSSPFVRALETARLLGRVLGLEPVVMDDLREQDYGSLRGRPYAALPRDRVPRGASLWQLRPPGGETLEEVAQRAGPALDAIAERHLGQQVVVVSHGGVMAALRAWSIEGFAGSPVVSANASGYVLARRRGRYQGPFALDESESEGFAELLSG